MDNIFGTVESLNDLSLCDMPRSGGVGGSVTRLGVVPNVLSTHATLPIADIHTRTMTISIRRRIVS